MAKIKQIENLDYYLQYWVGLMDGDGSIQVNHWRKKALQFRLVIKLKDHPLNVRLLKKMEQSVGGSMREPERSGFVFWVENDRKRIEKMCEIFERFPQGSPVSLNSCGNAFVFVEMQRRRLTA